MLSELRKGERADAGVRAWFEQVEDTDLFLSVLVIGELRQGIERKRRSDPIAASNLDRWFASLLENYRDCLLPIDDRVAEQWGRLNVPDPLPTVDGLIAATALVHDLTVVTRDEGDYTRRGVKVLNPFAPAPRASQPSRRR